MKTGRREWASIEEGLEIVRNKLERIFNVVTLVEEKSENCHEINHRIRAEHRSFYRY